MSQPRIRAVARSDRSGPGVAAGGVPLAVVALCWAGAMLWSCRATILGTDVAEMAVTSAAYALPGAISATLVAAAGVALAVLGRVGGRVASPTLRVGVGTSAGLLVGLVAGGSVLLTYPNGW